MLAAAATFLLFRRVLFVGYVPTESMEPAIRKGSYIVGCRMYSELSVGDVIVFWHEGKLLTKRIAAKGGDFVEKEGTSLAVPKGRLYVLGDNAENSLDSRYWEEPFVSEGNVIAKIFPWNY